MQEGMIGLFRAIQDFDPAKGAFGSFAKLCVQRQVISAVKASTRQKHQLLNEFVSFDARTDGQHALRDVLPGPQEEEPEALILQKQRLDEVHQAMADHAERTGAGGAAAPYFRRIVPADRHGAG